MRQLLYFSLATQNVTQEELCELLRIARQKNAEHGITGLLIYVGRYFMQYIEGPHEAIENLSQNIQNDDRISDFTVLIDKPASGRALPDWSMGFQSIKGVDVPNEDGFFNMKNVNDIKNIDLSDDLILNLMSNFYASNDPSKRHV